MRAGERELHAGGQRGDPVAATTRLDRHAPRAAAAAGAHDRRARAATTTDGRDRKQLERICRYLLRPPFAHDAVTALPGGRVRVSFKAPWRSGTAHADMDAHQFLARLCALVPPPGSSPAWGSGLTYDGLLWIVP